MRTLNQILLHTMVLSVVLVSCTQEDPETQDLSVSEEITAQIAALGFDVENQAPTAYDDGVKTGYIVEGDIFLTDEDLARMGQGNTLASVEQYSTDNLVNSNGGRNIAIYVSTSFGSTEVNAVDIAIQRFNDENLELTFSRVTSSGAADIVVNRYGRFFEFLGYVAQAGFPTASGDPYDEVIMSGTLDSRFGFSTEAIASVVAHELGHCIGFRHTDYFDRSISCGGSPSDEGDGGVGANHIPGTPTGATLADASWMLSCTDGSDRPFNTDDKTALDFLY